MTIVKPKPKGAVGFDAIETTADRLDGACMDREAGADGMRAREPGLRKR